MSVSHPLCPACGVNLVRTHTGALDTWVCPSGHGLSMTTSEAYERLQGDEIGQLWSRAKAATPTSAARKSPTTGRSMVCIEVTWDDDEVPEGRPTNGSNLGSVWLDVDIEDQVIWFDAAELDHFPMDLPDPEASSAELDKVEEIRAAFGQSIVNADAAREHAEFTERIYDRIAGHRGLTKILTEVGSLGRR